ncbi:hypothetical protein B566_EDAN001170 [Ephemera danica]|nr:hypothetical protein B566_EDAN001170 [Ephemera danica]
MLLKKSNLRLYRENNVKKASRKDWECVCITLEDWLGFLKQFRKTNNPQERELYQYLNLELFPLIENQLRGAGSRRGQLPGNDKLVQEEVKDVAAMLKEGQQDKAKACSETAAVESSGSLPKEEAAVVNGEDRAPASEVSGNSSTPGSDTLANGGHASAPQPSDTGQPSKGTSDCALSENSLVTAANIKTDDNSNSNQEFAGDPAGTCIGSGPGVPSVGMVGTGPQSAPPASSADGGQPLPSNVLPKQPPAEAQYMQQQSQIFVFSTNLANKAAESVLQGQFPTIIACHCAQPGTKKYLEKHPLKLAQFSRQQQNPAHWLNSFNQLKQQQQQHKPPTSSASSPVPAVAPPPPPNAPTGPPSSVVPPPKGMTPLTPNNMMADMGMPNWNQQGVNPLVPPPPASCQVHSPLKSCDSPMMGSAPVAQGSPSSQPTPMHHSPMMGPGVGSPNPIPQALMSSQPSLMGVKVPDENLTPQQRQHREEQLASLRKIQQLLFPEQQPGSGSAAGSPGQVPPGGPNAAEMPMMGGYPGLMGPHKNNVGGNMMSHQTPTSVAAQMEWQKLQHQFYEDRSKKKGGGRGRGQQLQSQQSHPASQQGPPPPPYHQSATRSASVPVALASPGTPNSPGNAAGSLGTSTLSLPSPRAASGLNSPGGFSQQPSMTSQQQRCLAGPSPSGPAGVDSPNSRGTLNISNPGTPIATPGPGPSPGHKEEFSPVAQQNAGDGMFGGRTLQSFTHQKQQQNTGPPKEPNLMPVPSPQQIQYLNTFEGQELTIQKQPNTSIRESDIMSPTLPSGSGSLEGAGPDPRVSGPNTPLTPSYTGPHTPHTPGGGDVGRFSVLPSSPHTPGGPASQQPMEKSKSDPGRFPPGSPVPRFSGSVPPTTPLSTSPGPPNPNFPKHQGFSSEGQSPPKLSPGSNSTFQPDNIPLNPNSSTANAGNPINKASSHFDPITSMAQMSQQLTNNNSPGQPTSGNMMGMNTPSNMGVSGPMPVMGPFGSPMHNPHHHHHHHHPMDGMMGMGPGGPPMQQHMQGMPMQQAGPPGPPPTGNYQGPPPHMSGQMPPGMCSGHGPGGTPPMMTSVAQQSPSPKPPGMSAPPGMMMMQPQPPRGSPPVPGHGQAYPGMPPMGPQQRMMLNRPPYNGANIQVKASTPNTIQYLPARPQSSNQVPRGPLNIDFLRFASPLSNLDNKVPTHNLQYFPTNNGQGNVNSNVTMGGPNVPMSMGGPGSQHMGGPGSQHMGGPVSGNMNNPMGPMGSAGGIPSNGQILGPNMPMGGMNGPANMGNIRPPRPPSAMMRGPPNMYQQAPVMPGGPPPQANLGPDQQVFGSQSGPNPAATMFVPGAKASPMGHAPDASQPLPPSMGQASNFKNSPFIGPTTADPNYAQQFHNFQQQLYATNTRSQMNNQAISQNQQFFGTK